MESWPKCQSIQISFFIPLKCCGPGFMLEWCHNMLFYDAANLIWQLTATKQSNLPSSLPFSPWQCVPASSSMLPVVPNLLPRGITQYCKLITELFLLLCFHLLSVSLTLLTMSLFSPRSACWTAKWANLPTRGRERSKGKQLITSASECLLCTYSLLRSTDTADLPVSVLKYSLYIYLKNSILKC